MKKILKPGFFILSLIPLIIILYRIFFNQLGPEPIKEITHHTGEWTLLFLIFTLSMTPLKKLTNLSIWISFRRMFGLFAFFYASLHLMTYVGLDYRFDLNSISKDVLTKKFIFIGFAAWLLMVPLAITSSKKMIALLKHNWKKLHKLVYVISIFGVIHFIWLVKKDLTEPLIYLAIIILLLAFRFDLNSISKDVLTKKFIFIGFAAWLLMVPLAITSSKKMMNLLKHNWKKLHKLVYVISIFGVIHFIWLVKKDLTEPLIYLAIIILLLAFRFDFKKFS